LTFSHIFIYSYAPHKIIYDTTHSNSKVAIISGGGAGHEPGHAGVIGRGMLTAAVSGEIFASPSASQICSGLDLANTDAGVIFVVNRYTGDCLNFGLATEKARAALAYSGNKSSGGVEMVIVGDDVAVGRERGGLVGRRGLAGNIITCKVLGAGSEKGLNVKQLKTLGDALIDGTVSIGTSLDHCHVPGRSKIAEDWGALPAEACEIGMGIHNEPGFKRLEKTPPASELIREMLHLLLNQNDTDRAYVAFDKDDAPAVLLNNLGGVSQLEMNALLNEVITQLADTYGLHPSRCYANQYMTSLNAPGFGISLVNHKKILKETGQDVLELLDAPTDAYAWSGVRTGWGQGTGKPRDRKAEEEEAIERLKAVRQKGGSVSGLTDDAKSSQGGPTNGDPELTKRAITKACENAIAAEPDMTRFDTIVGDGDAGETLEHAAKATIEALKKGEIDLNNAAGTCLSIGTVLESAMGGTSGAIYALFFAGLVQGLVTGPGKAGQAATINEWGYAAKAALTNLGTYTPARPGDRTLVDALTPFCESLANGKSLADSVAAAKQGAEATKTMRARLGRATYVASMDDKKDMPPDPGAWGVWALVDGLSQILK
jgi:triose/dihydroxyacetone kinase / FAD-AMP lyase (cyclizing)